MNMQHTQTFPKAARRRLVLISLGWALVALAEATAYTVLALAITQHQPPGMVITAAAVALFITVLVSRSGYLTGARLAGDLFQGVGAAFSHAKLSWFTEKNRALVGTVAGQSIPALMSVPAHQLQTFILSPLIPLLLLVGIAVVAGPLAMLLVAGLVIIAFLAQLLAQRALRQADAGRNSAEQAATEASLEFVDHLELSPPQGQRPCTEDTWDTHRGCARAYKSDIGCRDLRFQSREHSAARWCPPLSAHSRGHGEPGYRTGADHPHRPCICAFGCYSPWRFDEQCAPRSTGPVRCSRPADSLPEPTKYAPEHGHAINR